MYITLHYRYIILPKKGIEKLIVISCLPQAIKTKGKSSLNTLGHFTAL